MEDIAKRDAEAAEAKRREEEKLKAEEQRKMEAARRAEEEAKERLRKEEEELFAGMCHIDREYRELGSVRYKRGMQG